jgi:hypothetical protein
MKASKHVPAEHWLIGLDWPLRETVSCDPKRRGLRYNNIAAIALGAIAAGIVARLFVQRGQ